MPKAETRTTPIRSRRAVLAGVASAAAIPVAAAIPIAAAAPAQAAQMLDAELIQLGARLEPLVEQYYAARQPWARALVQRNREIEERFGDPADRGYQDTDEIRAAAEEIDNRVGLEAASDCLSAVHQRAETVAKAIEALPCRSIGGLRAKALVAFWEVAPLGADDNYFHFEDAYPFERLFCAVAELCGLDSKVAATGFDLPFALRSVNEEDEGEEA